MITIRKKTIEEIVSDRRVVLSSTIIGKGQVIREGGMKSSKDYSKFFERYYY